MAIHGVKISRFHARWIRRDFSYYHHNLKDRDTECLIFHESGLVFYSARMNTLSRVTAVNLPISSRVS